MILYSFDFLGKCILARFTCIYLKILQFSSMGLCGKNKEELVILCCFKNETQTSPPVCCCRMRWSCWRRTWSSVGIRGRAWRSEGPRLCSRASPLAWDAWRRRSICPASENIAGPSSRWSSSVSLSSHSTHISIHLSCSDTPSHRCCLFSWGGKLQDMVWKERKKEPNISPKRHLSRF